MLPVYVLVYKIPWNGDNLHSRLFYHIVGIEETKGWVRMLKMEQNGGLLVSQTEIDGRFRTAHILFVQTTCFPIRVS